MNSPALPNDSLAKSSAGFAVNPENLIVRSRQLGEIAHRTRQVAVDLAATLENTPSELVGNPEIHDPVSTSFAAAHAGPAQETLRQIHSLPERFHDFAESFFAAAWRYRSEDEAAALQVSGISRDLSEPQSRDR
jgi:hypothetical protein